MPSGVKHSAARAGGRADRGRCRGGRRCTRHPGTTRTPGRNYVKTLRCPAADLWPGPPLHTWVDVWNRITYPSDGLPPAIALVADTRREQTTMTPITEYRCGSR